MDATFWAHRTPISQSIPRARSRRSIVALAALGIGLALVGISLVVPWITVFRGLQPIPGFQLEGGKLGGVAVGVVGLLAVAATLGGRRILRPIAVLGTIGIVIDAALVRGQIAAYVADPGPAGLLTQPSLGPGAAMMAVGGGLLLLAALLIPLRNDRLPPHAALRVLMATGLLVAGWIHLLLVPEHLAQSTVLGLGFLASGIAQVALSGLVIWRSRVWNLTAVVALNATLIVVYAYAVLVGLPLSGGEHGGDAVGLVVGAGEPIDVFGAISKVAELVSLVLAFALLGRTAGASEDKEAVTPSPATRAAPGSRGSSRLQSPRG